jgi:hypothetical protein
MVIQKGQVGVSPDKVKVILEEKPLTTKKGIHCFLGITNYHQRFIKDYAKIARPLNELTKDVPFAWSEAQATAFDSLKQALISGPVLVLLRDKGHFQLETDALDVMTGAVLPQQQEDGMYHPLGFISKSFNEAEQCYTTYDRELLGIMWALEDWRSLLIGAEEPFKILTDHQNLMYLQDPQKLMEWQVNWTTKLQDFDFIIKHIGGDTNAWADALSRLEGVDKVVVKVDTVLPDRFFM